MNELARPEAAKLAQAWLATPHGQPFTTLYLAQGTEWKLGAATTDGFVVTYLPGVITPEMATAQLSYGAANATLGGQTPTMVKILGVRPSEVSPLLESLNRSPTFSAMIASPEWKGSLSMGWEEGRAVLRYGGVPVSRLKPPTGTAAAFMVRYEYSVTMPALVDEAAVADLMARAGRPVEQATLGTMVAKLAPYAGQAIRIVGYGLDVWFVAEILSETGTVIFRLGPEWVVGEVGIGTYDPTGGDQNLYQSVWQNPFVNLTATSVPSVDLYALWSQIQERDRLGEAPCVFLASADTNILWPVGCSTTEVVQGQPQGMSLFWPDGQEMVIELVDNQWVTTQTSTQQLNTLDPLTSCNLTFSVSGLPPALVVTPACQWAQPSP